MSTRTHHPLAASPRSIAPARRRLLRAGTAVAAALVAAVGWTIAAVTGLNLDVISFGQPQTVSLASAIVGGLVPGLTGWALLALLERLTRSARRIWTVIASVILVLSLVNPLLATASLSTTIVLLVLHLVVGAVLIIGMRRSTR